MPRVETSFGRREKGPHPMRGGDTGAAEGWDSTRFQSRRDADPENPCRVGAGLLTLRSRELPDGKGRNVDFLSPHDCS